MDKIFNQLVLIANDCGNDCELRVYEDETGEIYADGQQLFQFSGLQEFSEKLSEKTKEILDKNE